MAEEAEQKPTNGIEQDGAKTDADSPDAAGAEEQNEDAAAPSEPVGEDAAPDYQALAVELNDKMLRAVAELENYRRRAEKERQDTAKFAITGFARDCLTVLDNLRRGLDSVTKEDRDGSPALEALAAGMELTERELITTLERHGIQKVDPMGEPFDYDRHQAMFEVDDASKPAGTVVEVVQTGYLLNDRLLRPAMVAVAKGGPKPDAVQAPIANEDLAAAPSSAAQDQAGSQDNAPPDSDGGADGTDGHVDTKA